MRMGVARPPIVTGSSGVGRLELMSVNRADDTTALSNGQWKVAGWCPDSGLLISAYVSACSAI
jgi:hypothetical protein